MAKLPAFRPIPTHEASDTRPTRYARVKARKCLLWRGCTCKPGHIGPHIIMVKVRKNRPR